MPLQVSLQERETGKFEDQGGGSNVTIQGEISGTQPASGNADSHQKQEVANNRFSSIASQGP